jgi:hypothetical protein
MTTKSKVGSWLEKTAGSDASTDDEDVGDNVDDSASEAESSAGPANHVTKVDVYVASEDEDEDMEEEQKVEKEDWATTLPRIRSSLMDPSKKRRRAFISRYLSVSPECELIVAPHMKKQIINPV